MMNRSPTTQNFDVFLSYNSKDRGAVQRVAEALKEQNLTVWFDQWELSPGGLWLDDIEEGIQNSRSAAIFIGKGGIGVWEKHELQSFSILATNSNMPVIPVLLYGAEEKPKLPAYLHLRTWVDLRNGMNTQALKKFIWGITGEKPEKDNKNGNTNGWEVPKSTIDSLIIDNIKNGCLIPFIGPGISPKFYIELSKQLGEKIGIPLLPQDSKNHSIVGMPCPQCHLSPEDRPHNCPMINSISQEENSEQCLLLIEQTLAVSKINLRYLSQYYILSNSEDPFYGKLYSILRRLKEEHKPNSIHTFLSRLPSLMKTWKYPAKSPGLPFQLIVTTNYDDMLEQSFRDADQPYDVVFYVAGGEDNCGKFMHVPYGETEPQIISADESERLPLRRPWGKAAQPRPIILKLYGTWETQWENSCVVTEQQIASLIRNLKQVLPTSLMSILTKGNILFMGYSPSDSDLALLTNCLWQNNRIPGKSWLIHQAKPGDLELKTWERLNVKLLDIPYLESSFIDDFQAKIELSVH